MTLWSLAVLALACRQDTTGHAVLEGTLRGLNVRAAGAVVYLVPMDSAPPALPPDTALIDQRNLSFAPRTLVVQPGAVVEFRNSDPLLHNVFSPPGPDSGFDLGTYPRTERRSHTFLAPGAYVILCHVHPEMVAFVVVVPTPHFGVVDEESRYRVDRLRPGRYRLGVWQWRATPRELVVRVHEGAQRVDLELTSAKLRR